MATLQVQDTEFNCKICGVKVVFNVFNTDSFESKTPHERFFGMQLTTYRVAHAARDFNERHLNTVLVDHQGFFRGFIDAYSEPFPEIKAKIVIKEEWELIPEEDGSLLAENEFFDTLLVFDRNALWVLGVIHSPIIKPVAIAKLLLEKIVDTEQIYKELPDKISYSIADKVFHVWNEGSRFIAAVFKEDQLNEKIELIIKEILSSFVQRRGTVTRRRIIILALNASSSKHLTEDDLPAIRRLLTDNALFTTIKVKYENHIPRIIDRLAREFPIAGDILEKLLKGETTVIELLESKYLDRYREIFDLIDFINRRKLLE
ncbi:MAG: hypothetical protein ACFFD4_19505 [Candidatus Odinarchaeota archaeon]